MVALPTLLLCAPDRLQLPSPSPSRSLSRPPGFDASPVQVTPPFISESPLRRTPERVRAAAVLPVLEEALFLPCEQPLLPQLPQPSSPRPRRPSNRRKTLAGVAMTSTGGFSLRRVDEQSKGKSTLKACPVADAAETMVCRGLGIISDGQVVTAAALDDFSSKFKDKVEPEVMQKIRVLFKVDSAEDEAVDEALIGHGGARGLDIEADDEADVVADV
jgi:hypothetical protein